MTDEWAHGPQYNESGLGFDFGNFNSICPAYNVNRKSVAKNSINHWILKNSSNARVINISQIFKGPQLSLSCDSRPVEVLLEI